MPRAELSVSASGTKSDMRRLQNKYVSLPLTGMVTIHGRTMGLLSTRYSTLGIQACGNSSTVILNLNTLLAAVFLAQSIVVSSSSN